MKKRMKKVYVAGPYTKGDVAQNVRIAIEYGDRLIINGYIPYIPHLTHFWHLIFPHDYEYWLNLDNEWLALCDMVLRIPGDSPGADAEVELAKSLGIPVYYSMRELP